jgi:tetratricopeptide (TPR) repeat protein
VSVVNDGSGLAALPDPGGARTLDELVDRLRLLKAWSGAPSYETIKDRVNASWQGSGRPPADMTAKSTVADCFKRGRRRVDAELVVAVVAAMHPDPGYVAQWRQALRVVLSEIDAAGQVRVHDTLPDDLAHFTGREEALAALWEATGPPGGFGDGGVADEEPAGCVVALEGMPGVGKTRLAVHFGHLLLRRLPFDHVLFVDLRGVHADQPPVAPGAVLDGFLRLLGVPGAGIPHDLDRREAAYRQQVAGRRMLVVLDNAADEAQVRRLLPRSPGYAAIVTSRRSLAGLEAATRLTLDVFTPGEALSLLTRVAPTLPAGDDPEALLRVARRCAYLPLALDLVGTHMGAKAGWTATDHAEWLDERHRSHRLDDAVDVALNLSYGGLPPALQRTFRLLGTHPGHDADAYAVAALADVDLATAGEHLDRLAAEHLLRTSAPGRYVFHDLVRAFAVHRAQEEDGASSRRAAMSRLLDHQLCTASLAMDVLVPAEQHRRPRVPASRTPRPELAEPGAGCGGRRGGGAQEWLETERANLVAAAVHAAGHGRPDHTIALAATLFRHLDSGGHFQDGLTLHTHARDAARACGDLEGQARALLNLGTVHERWGHYEESIARTSAAIDLFGRLGMQLEQARALGNRAGGYERMGDYQRAFDDVERSLALFREVGGQALDEARALANLGVLSGRLGRLDEAIAHNVHALEVCRRLAYRDGEMWGLVNLADAYLASGRPRDALPHAAGALELARELRHHYGEPWAMLALGRAQAGLGRAPEGTDHVRGAADLLRTLGDPEGEAEARAHLKAVESAPP